MLERDFRHFRQILVQKIRKVLRLHVVCGFREPLNVGKENRQLFAVRRNRNILVAAENELVDLR